MLDVLYEYLLYAYQYLLLSLDPDEQILILTSPAQVHVGESIYGLAKIIIKKIIYFCEAPLSELYRHKNKMSSSKKIDL